MALSKIASSLRMLALNLPKMASSLRMLPLETRLVGDVAEWRLVLDSVLSMVMLLLRRHRGGRHRQIMRSRWWGLW